MRLSTISVSSPITRQQASEVLKDQKDAVHRLDSSLQTIINSVARGYNSTDRLIQLFREDGQLTRDHIDRQVQQIRQQQTEAKYRAELLESLHYPEINCRIEEINDAHAQTFEWIFGRNGCYSTQGPNFTEWLERGSGLFWINGKAGSGKSTLMRHIWQDPRTMSHLQYWAGSYTLIIPCFFFWAAGTPLQRTLIGLLRSLIYQILQFQPSLFNYTIKTSHHSGPTTYASEAFEPITIWTERKLLKCLDSLLESASPDCRLCLFLDGLDEFGGNHWEFVEFLNKVTSSGTVKCCASSRPERPFNSLSSSAGVLNVEQHTRQDIEIYVNEKFMEAFKHTGLAISQDQYDQIIREILLKADGVFLWVEVVVSSQLARIRNDDDFDLLWSQLNSLPNAVEDLYFQMLSRVERLYRIEAAKYLRYVYTLKKIDNSDEGHPVTVFDLALALSANSDDIKFQYVDVDLEKILSKCKILKDRIKLTCAGLLTVREGDSWLYGEFDDDFDRTYPWVTDEVYNVETGFGYDNVFVGFHHRTVKDFLEKGNPGNKFLENNSAPPIEYELLRVTLYLARLTLCKRGYPCDYFNLQVQRIFACLKKSIQGAANTAAPYLNNLDQTLNKCHSRSRIESDFHLHWCKHCPLNSEIWASELGMYWPVRDFCRRRDVPQDFLCFTASWQLWDYVYAEIERKHVSMSAESFTDLLLCTFLGDPQDGSYYRRRSDPNWIQLVTYLVNRGADVRSDIGKGTWNILLAGLIHTLSKGEYVVSDNDMTDSELRYRQSILGAFDAFLQQGADRHPVVIVSLESVGFAGLAIDFATVPVIDWYQRGRRWPDSRIFQEEVNSSAIDQKALHIYFWGKRCDLSRLEAYRIHRCIRACLDAEGRSGTEHDLKNLVYGIKRNRKGSNNWAGSDNWLAVDQEGLDNSEK